MTRQEYAELIAGERQIQRIANSQKDEWQDVDWKDVVWSYPRIIYRHKPEPKYRPYTPQEILDYIEYQMERTNDQPIFIDVSINKEYRVIGVNNKCIIARDEDLEYTHIELGSFLVSWYIWKDGSPCGVEVTE